MGFIQANSYFEIKSNISQPFSEIINLSIQLGKYSSKLKLAKIVPGDDETEAGNYLYYLFIIGYNLKNQSI